jgi:RNA polymerase sigma-70 factor, ECF subfamily
VLRSTRHPRPADLRNLADEDLMELVCEGDARAFELVFDRHADAAFSLAHRMCGKRSVAEDVVQEAFLSLWRSGARYDPARGSVRSWVLRVVHNRAVDAFRRAAVRANDDVSDDGIAERLPAAEMTDAEAERRENVREVRVALSGLPADQRRVIELAYFGGLSHTQIAEMLNVPAATVKGRMRHGLANMRTALGDQAGVAM